MGLLRPAPRRRRAAGPSCGVARGVGRGGGRHERRRVLGPCRPARRTGPTRRGCPRARALERGPGPRGELAPRRVRILGEADERRAPRRSRKPARRRGRRAARSRPACRPRSRAQSGGRLPSSGISRSDDRASSRSGRPSGVAGRLPERRERGGREVAGVDDDSVVAAPTGRRPAAACPRRFVVSAVRIASPSCERLVTQLGAVEAARRREQRARRVHVGVGRRLGVHDLAVAPEERDQPVGAAQVLLRPVPDRGRSAPRRRSRRRAASRRPAPRRRCRRPGRCGATRPSDFTYVSRKRFAAASGAWPPRRGVVAVATARRRRRRRAPAPHAVRRGTARRPPARRPSTSISRSRTARLRPATPPSSATPASCDARLRQRRPAAGHQDRHVHGREADVVDRRRVLRSRRGRRCSRARGSRRRPAPA